MIVPQIKSCLYSTLVCILLMLLCPAGGSAAPSPQSDPIAPLLADYETAKGKQKTSIANRIMEELARTEFTDEVIHFNDNFPPDSLNCNVWYWASEWNYAWNRYKEALDYGMKALPLCEGTDMEADCLNLLSLCCFRLSKYEQAVGYAKRCYKLDEQSGDPDIMSSSLNTIAGIYLGANQPKEGEKYILKAIELASQASNPPRMAVLYGMASEIYHALGDGNKALEYIDKSYNIEKELGREDRMMVRLSQKSSVLLGIDEYSKAEEVLGEAISFFRKIGDRHSLGISCNKMGMALLAQERLEEAVEYYREAAGIFLEMGDMRNEMHSRKGLYESLWGISTDSAKVELERFNDLKDSLYSSTAAESLARYNAEFGSDWLKVENAHQKARTRRILFGAAILLLAVAVGIWMLMKRRMRMHDAALNTVIEELKASSNKENAGRRETVESAVRQQPASENGESLSQTEKYFLEQLVNHITQNMAEGNISVEHLASLMCITRGQLNRRVKSVTGVTTQQYISRVRMEYARILLENSPELSIYDISCKCGFEDATSFSRAFRRTFSKSPQQCRNSASGQQTGSGTGNIV